MRVPTRHRLALILGFLEDLQAQGRETVTSRDLGRWTRTTGASIRKDLEDLQLQVPGAGYPVSLLLEKLRELFPRIPRRCILAGLGDLGLGLADRLPPGWTLVAGFDSRLNRLEQLSLPFRTYHSTEITPLVLREKPDVGILACEAQETAKFADRMIQGGLRVLINYTNAPLRVNQTQIQVFEAGLVPLDRWIEA